MENMKHEGAIMVIEHLWDRVIHESHLFFAAEEEIMELPEGEIKNNYLEVIIKYSLQQGWEEEAQKRAEALKRKLRVDELKFLLENIEKNGSRKQMEEAIELLPEEETRTKRKFLKILIKDYLDHQLYKKAKRIAKILDDLYKEEIKEG